MTQDQPTKTLGRLLRLAPRDTRTAAAQSLAYTRAVKFMRWLLPLFALFGLGLLMIWPTLRAQKISAVMVDNVPNLMVEKLHLTGIDSRNQPYSLTASRALQAANAQNLVDLERPEAEISLSSGGWLSGRAAYGRLDQKAKKLWLGGAVELFHDEGHRFLTDEMNVDLTASAVWGEKPVLLQGSFGEIRGQGFKLLEAGRVFVVVGPATAKLSLQPGQASDKRSVNTSSSR